MIYTRIESSGVAAMENGKANLYNLYYFGVASLAIIPY